MLETLPVKVHVLYDPPSLTSQVPLVMLPLLTENCPTSTKRYTLLSECSAAPVIPRTHLPFNALSENALEVALRISPVPRLPCPVTSSYSMILPLPPEFSTKAKVTGPHELPCTVMVFSPLLLMQ